MSVLRIIAGVGSVLRQAGRAVDSLGASMQGRYAYKETRAPTYRDRTCFATYVLVVLRLTQGRRAVATHQTLQEYMGKRPTLAPDAFVAPNASVIGNVTLGKGSSVWYGAILRGKRTIVLALPANQRPALYVWGPMVACHCRRRKRHLRWGKHQHPGWDNRACGAA